MCTVAEKLNLLDLAPLLHDDFLWLEAKKIPLYLDSTTAVSALSMKNLALKLTCWVFCLKVCICILLNLKMFSTPPTIKSKCAS